MSFLPRFASYRFRLPDDAAQRTFTLPDYLSRRRLSGFYLRQEPSHRASYECGHSLRVNVSAGDKLTFDLGGIADWEHEGRAHDFVPVIRETASRVFGPATTLTQGLFNDLDRFSVPSRRADLPLLIEQYVRELTPHFPITRGDVSYVHTLHPRKVRQGAYLPLT